MLPRPTGGGQHAPSLLSSPSSILSPPPTSLPLTLALTPHPHPPAHCTHSLTDTHRCPGPGYTTGLPSGAALLMQGEIGATKSNMFPLFSASLSWRFSLATPKIIFSLFLFFSSLACIHFWNGKLVTHLQPPQKAGMATGPNPTWDIKGIHLGIWWKGFGIFSWWKTIIGPSPFFLLTADVICGATVATLQPWAIKQEVKKATP